jgi:RimJ/RimL family protein N-acetyltransferase
MIELVGKHVRLRPFRPEEFDTVWAIHRAAHRARGRSLRDEKRRLRSMFHDSGRVDVDVVYLAIETDRVLVGEIDVRRIDPRSSDVFERGIELYEEVTRGKGLGGEAFGLVVSYLFAHRSATRVEVSTAADNTRMRRILETHGFSCTRESASRAEYLCVRSDWEEPVSH